MNDNDNIYKLKHPIEIRDKESGDIKETITELTLVPRAKGKHLKAMDRAEGETGKTLALIGAVTNQPPAVMDLMDAEDVIVLGDMVVSRFFGGRLPTGAMSTGT